VAKMGFKTGAGKTKPVCLSWKFNIALKCSLQILKNLSASIVYVQGIKINSEDIHCVYCEVL
jgi:hypothetical protein